MEKPSPDKHMANPIIARELIQQLRQPRGWLIQLLFAGSLAALVIFVWPDNATVNLGGRQAQQLLAVFAYGLLTGLMLLAPAFPAMAIVRERQQGTLRLLLTSPLTPTAILIGKLSGALGFIFILLVLSLPAAAACFAMGGVSVHQLAVMYAVLALAAAQYATLGLLVSSIAKSTDAALRTTYGLILLLAIIVVGPYYMLQGHGLGPIIDSTIQHLASLSPLPAVMNIVGHQEVATRGLVAEFDPVSRYAFWAIASIVLCAIVTLTKLQPHSMDRPRDKGYITEDQTKGVRVFRRVMFLIDPNRRTGSIANYENPVMMKEFRTRTFGRAHWMVRLIGTCVVVSLLLMLLSTLGTMFISPDYMGGVLVIFQMGLIVLVTPALSSALISGELEGGGWTLLQVTPLSARSIIVGKLLSVGWTLLLILLATLPGYAILLMIDYGKADRVYNVLISLCLTSLFALMLGAACSSVCRRTAAATTAAYVILLGLCVVTLLPWLAEGSLLTHQLVEQILQFNPLAATLAAIKMPGMTDYHLLPGNWIFIGSATAVCAAVLWFRTWQLTKPQ